MNRRGVLVSTEQFDSAALVQFAKALDARGYDSLWLPELFGREPIATAGYLLGKTERIAVATGIANVYVRDAHAMAQARHTLSELSGGRFMLGLGVSNAGLNTSRGHTWRAPLEKMTAFLDALDKVEVAAPAAPRCPTYIAAHGPQLQALGAKRTDGVITYLMTPQHAQQTRARIGAKAALSVVAMFLAEQDPNVARAKARSALKMYVRLDYYHREWRKLGFVDADFADGGSDRLIDALVAWGNDDALRARIAAFDTAGATRVIVMPLGVQTKQGLDFRVLDALAPSPPDAALGTIRRAQGGFEARLERAIAHDQKSVWAMLTEPAKLPQWLAPGELSQTGGGRAVLHFQDSGTVIDSAVSAVDAPRLIEYSWSGPGEPVRPVRWELAARDGGTHLVLTLRIPETEDIAKSCAGWEAHLQMLLAALDGAPIKFPFDRFKAAREAYKLRVPSN